jgi:BTB/POZ domain
MAEVEVEQDILDDLLEVGDVYSAFAEEMRVIFDVPDICDTVVKCQGGNLHVSRVLLLARAPYFKNFFALQAESSASSSSSASSNNMAAVEWLDCSYAVARELLLFIYTDACNIRQGQLDKLLELGAVVLQNSARFSTLLQLSHAAVVNSSARATEVPISAVVTILEQLYRYEHLLQPDSTQIADTLAALGGQHVLWQRVLPAPLPTFWAQQGEPEGEDLRQLLLTVPESVVSAMLQWQRPAEAATGQQQLGEVALLSSVLAWCFVRASAAVTLQQLFAPYVDSFSVSEIAPGAFGYTHRLGALDDAQLLQIYKAQAHTFYPSYKQQKAVSHAPAAAAAGTGSKRRSAAGGR